MKKELKLEEMPSWNALFGIHYVMLTYLGRLVTGDIRLLADLTINHDPFSSPKT